MWAVQFQFQDDDVYLGRVRNDGKLTVASIYLEGSLEESQGHIVSLDFSALDEYFVFPGQVIDSKEPDFYTQVRKVNAKWIAHAIKLPLLA